MSLAMQRNLLDRLSANNDLKILLDSTTIRQVSQCHFVRLHTD